MSALNNSANIIVIGVGGGGVNAVDRMIQEGVAGVDFIAMNTDSQSLMKSEAELKLDIGHAISRGLGAGADPTVGRRAAEENADLIKASLENADMVFVTAGEGGGTGTGAAPVVAEIARSVGALTVGVVTRPFKFEGRQRANNASSGLAELRKSVDALIVIPNDRLLEISDETVTVLEAFHMADEVLHNGVKGISEIITTPGVINVDFADVKAIMKDAGTALMGIGESSGDDRSLRAAELAISSPLLEASIDGARGVLLAFQSGDNLGLHEMQAAASLVQESADPNANIIFGHIVDDSLGDVVRVTVIAAGFDEPQEKEYSRTGASSLQADPEEIAPLDIADPEPLAAVSPASSVLPPVLPEPEQEKQLPRRHRASRELDIPDFLFEEQ